MKKNLLMMAVIVLTVVMAHAETSQSVVATLNHEGNVTTFMGGNGLRDALAAAADGDAIVLSPGTFNASNITKAVTLRGAGSTMLSLPDAGIDPVAATYITGDMSVNINSTEGKLAIEGIQFNNVLNFTKAPAVDVFKTRIAEIRQLAKEVASINFTHCDIYCIENNLNEHVTMMNTVYRFRSFNPFLNAINCVFVADGYAYAYTNNGSASGGGQLTNCIFLHNGYDSSYTESLPANCTAYNCIACIKQNGSYTNFMKFFDNSYNGTNTVICNLSMFNAENVFPSYPFTLTEEAAAQYLGNDGTQVGIHGGALPIDPIPDNLLVTKCNIAPKTTATGKLQIEIQVSTAK